MRETVRTAEVAVTLALTTDELRTLLSDNTDLVSGLFATIVQRGGADDHPVVPSTAGAVDFEELAQGGLTPVEKVLALRRVPLFARLAAEEMSYLSAVARTITMQADETLFAESAPPALWVLLSGDVVLQGSAGMPPVTAGAGDVIGSMHAMAGRPLGRNAVVSRAGIALRIDRDELFDLLADRPEMLRQMFAALFRRTEQPVVA
jgi:CRP-like cAMP-binding protein